MWKIVLVEAERRLGGVVCWDWSRVRSAVIVAKWRWKSVCLLSSMPGGEWVWVDSVLVAGIASMEQCWGTV
jgi:hypothetical protein